MGGSGSARLVAPGARLADSGASLVVCDLDPERCESFVARHGGEIAPSAEAIKASPLDVLAPALQAAPSTTPSPAPSTAA